MPTVNPSPRTVLTTRYAAALDYARVLHADDVRKGTNIPYLSHLMSVSALVLEHGGSEDQAIAALLHDAAEDHGGDKMLDALHAEFGAVVADIVRACSDSLVEDPSTKAPWIERKKAYLAHLADRRHTPDMVVLVSAADKLHNARAILADYRRYGEALWERFNPAARGAGSCWYYDRLAVVLCERLDPLGSAAAALGSELRRTVDATLREVRGKRPDLDTEMESFDASPDGHPA